jgi:hypothetical protein
VDRFEAEIEEVAARYERIAAELELAAAHARTAAGHFREHELARGPAHGFSVYGHVRKVRDILDELARLHADRSEP